MAASTLQDNQRPGEERGLQNDSGDEVRIKRGRDEMKDIMKDPFAQSVTIEKGRPGMVKSKARVIAVEGFEVFRLENLQGVRGEIGDLGVLVAKKEGIIARQDDGGYRQTNTKERPCGMFATWLTGASVGADNLTSRRDTHALLRVIVCRRRILIRR